MTQSVFAASIHHGFSSGAIPYILVVAVVIILVALVYKFVTRRR
jgi:FlaG/FlaF family flagellin (archaellin)